MQKRTKRTLLVIALILILSVLALVFYRSLRPQAPDAGGLENAPVIAPDVSNLEDLERYVQNKPLPAAAASGALYPLNQYDHVYGNRDADTMVILYANMQNKFAALMLPELKALVQGSDDIGIVFRHFPNETPAEDLRASLMAECIALQAGEESFWVFVDTVIGVPQNDDSLAFYAQEFGAEPTAAMKCVNDRQTWNFVLSQRQQGELRSGVQISPSVVIWHRPTNDIRVLAGANPMTYVNEVIADMRE
jgi:protein-disulfide isomerase